MLEGQCRCGAVRVWATATGTYERPGLAAVRATEWSGPVEVSSGGDWRLCGLCGTTLGKKSSLCVSVVPGLIPAVDALHRAAEEGDLEAVQRLVLEGSVVDGHLEGRTPWELAHQSRHYHVCDFLVEQGARPPRSADPPQGAFEGQCRCGSIRFRVYGGPPGAVNPETSLERPARYLCVDQGRFEILRGQRLLQEAWGSKEVRCYLCRRCKDTVRVKSPDNPNIAYVPAKRLNDSEAAARLCPAGSITRAVAEAQALHDAISCINLQKVGELLAAGISVEAKVARETALERAVRTGNLQLISFLIDNGADVHAVRHLDNDLSNYAAVLQLLVDRGKSLQGFLADEVKLGNIATVRKLLRAGADLNRHDEEEDWVMPLHWSAHNSNAMIRFVIANGADMQVISKGGGHALGFCALWGKTSRLRTLLECGFPVDLEQGRPGDTALFEACRHGWVDCVKLLLEYGADPNLAFQSWTPLMMASRHGSLAIVNMLLDHGADPKQRDDEGRDAAEYARRAQPHLLEQTRSFARGKNSAGETILFTRGDPTRAPVWTVGHRAILERLGHQFDK